MNYSVSKRTGSSRRYSMEQSNSPCDISAFSTITLTFGTREAICIKAATNTYDVGPLQSRISGGCCNGRVVFELLRPRPIFLVNPLQPQRRGYSCYIEGYSTSHANRVGTFTLQYWTWLFDALLTLYLGFSKESCPGTLMHFVLLFWRTLVI